MPKKITARLLLKRGACDAYANSIFAKMFPEGCRPTKLLAERLAGSVPFDWAGEHLLTGETRRYFTRGFARLRRIRRYELNALDKRIRDQQTERDIVFSRLGYENSGFVPTDSARRYVIGRADTHIELRDKQREIISKYEAAVARLFVRAWQRQNP